MVGILKGLKSDESVENNTKAFSVLIAFSGGVWRGFLSICSPVLCTVVYDASIQLYSALCYPMVLV